MQNSSPKLNAKDFATDQAVRWCPGCGDYAILNSVKKVLATLGKRKEDVVFVSGIGCSSRFPYYVDTFGMHSIHGRAVAIATGTKIHNPLLSVWAITGDGDGLAIGGNHFIHAVRRNININILIFNNEIYGLTKGQYSPTSKLGQRTKTSPMGTIERPFSPAMLALGAGATFFARTTASDPKHLQEILLRAEAHCGTSVVEIYQNCVIFNDEAFEEFLGKENRDDHTVLLEHDRPLVFGKGLDKAVRWANHELLISTDVDYAVIHDEQNLSLSFSLAKMETVKPLGVYRCVQEPEYASGMNGTIETKSRKRVSGLLHSGSTWEID